MSYPEPSRHTPTPAYPITDQPATPPGRRRRWPWIVAATAVGLVLLCFGVAAIGNLVGDSPEGSAASTPISAPTTPDVDMGSIAAALGIPPKPDAETQAKYVAALEAIDPEIVHGKPDQMVSRGRSQCSSIKKWPNDEAKLIDLANKRFTAPGHSGGFGEAKAKRILKVVREYICPGW